MSEYDLSKFDKVLADVAQIQEDGNFIPDCSTKEGYEASKRFVLDVTTPARTALTEAHKETKRPFWDACKFLDEKKKELMPLLEAAELPHKLAYKAVDEEKKRIKAEKEALVQKGFDDLNCFLNQSVAATSEMINGLLNECADFDVDPDVYGSKTDELIKLHAGVMTKLTDALTRQIQFEEMESKQREIEEKEREIKAAEEEKEKARYEDQLKAEAIKAQAEQAERERIASAEREEKAKQEAIEAREQAKRDAELAEQRRLADIEQARQEEIARQKKAEQEAVEAESARLANAEHVRQINNDALLDLTSMHDCALTEEQAKAVIIAIAKNKISHVTINY